MQRQDPPSPPSGRASQRKSSLYERALRQFSGVMHMLSLAPFYVLCALCMGLAAAPGIAIFHGAEELSAGQPLAVRGVLLGCGLAFGYLAYGLSLILIMPAANWICRCKLRPWRGSYYSSETVKWYVHNGLTYVVRYTFLDFITPTPLNILFFRLMGMKVGSRAQINTSHISDPSLITLGDNVTIGGSATIIGHYGVGGVLVLSPTVIGDRATVGLRAIVMGGAVIGADAKILPNSVVLPKTKIGAGETWAGVPARLVAARVSGPDGGAPGSNQTNLVESDQASLPALEAASGDERR